MVVSLEMSLLRRFVFRKGREEKRAESIAFDSFLMIKEFITYFVTTNFFTADSPSIVAFTK